MPDPSRRVLPKDALTHVVLGHSFAEYDPLIEKAGIYVNTPASITASSSTSHRSIFVGRRGTGKTALAKHLEKPGRNLQILTPHIFGNPGLPHSPEQYRDVRQRPFHSLVIAFKLAFLTEILSQAIAKRWIEEYDVVGDLHAERTLASSDDLDSRILDVFEHLSEAVANEKAWLRFLNRPKKLTAALSKCEALQNRAITFLIDRIDEDWDGSSTAVTLLTAMLHAAVQLNSDTAFCRVKVFLRENIFDRVRETDNEFSRLETSVMSLDWSKELLLELIERRLQSPFVAKPALGGETWDYFFEPFDGRPSYEVIFEFCQIRPRDVLTYCDYAIEGAKARKHLMVGVDDIIAARKKFSENRLKDLADEYAENYPQIGIVLDRFFGLGKRFTITGLRDFIAALCADGVVKANCSSWIFNYAAPEQFVKLLYSLGFLGVDSGTTTVFRTPGWRAEAMPPLQEQTIVTIHPMYCDALQLADRTFVSLDGTELREAGLILDGGLDLTEYRAVLSSQIDDLKSCPLGQDAASQYEDIVGNVIRHCFLGRLGNVESQVRDVSNTKRRDWIAANIAQFGFWEMIKVRYRAIQVIWECKNLENLGADDFRQLRSYLNDTIGSFGLLCFRGEIKKHYYEHLKEMAARDGKIIVLLNDKDLMVFLRQSIKGKQSESHLQTRFDDVIRHVS